MRPLKLDVRRIKMIKFILILTLVLLFSIGCSSARIVNEQDLPYFAKGLYMGSKDGFHHFQIPELETVFYEHVKIPVQEYRVEHEMPYTIDEEKWQTVILRPNIYMK
jgi:hypothetical protein